MEFLDYFHIVFLYVESFQAGFYVLYVILVSLILLDLPDIDCIFVIVRNLFRNVLSFFKFVFIAI
jgi:hypothetical protein